MEALYKVSCVPGSHLSHCKQFKEFVWTLQHLTSFFVEARDVRLAGMRYSLVRSLTKDTLLENLTHWLIYSASSLAEQSTPNTVGIEERLTWTDRFQLHWLFLGPASICTA